MGLFWQDWQSKDTQKAMAAAAFLESDGALLRAAKHARDEAVALFAVSRIQDQLLLERLALGEPRVSARVAGMALQRLAGCAEFTDILQRFEYEEGESSEPRVTAVLSAAMDLTEDPTVFAKLLKTLTPKERSAYLKHCMKDDDFMPTVLLHCVGLFSCDAPEMEAILWRFSDKTILKALGLLDDFGVTLSDAATVLVGGLRTTQAVLEALGTAKAIKERLMALERITDQPTLLEIALSNDSATVRHEAAERLNRHADIIQFIDMMPYQTTESLLQKALGAAPVGHKGGRTGQKRGAAAPALSQEQLYRVATRSFDKKARKKAGSMLTDPDDFDLYAGHNMSDLDEETVLRVESQPLLAKLACDGFPYRQSIRMAAVSRLTVDERLGQVVWVHTQDKQTEEKRQLVRSALSRIKNQDIIYQAMGLADDLMTYIDTDAVDYITDADILLKVVLGGSRFAEAAAEKIQGEAALKEIVLKSNPGNAAYEVACRKLEDMRIAALGSLDESALMATVDNDPSSRVRTAAVPFIEDQDFLEKHALYDESLGVRAAACVRLTRWAALLKMVLEDSISLDTVLERLCSDGFISERAAIVAAAAVYVKSGAEGQASRFAHVIAKLAGLGIEEVYVRYAGMGYVEKQIEKLLNCRELEDYNHALHFLRYAYGKSSDCRDALEKLNKHKVIKHDDFVARCDEDSYSIMVEEIIDFV